jgi:hypothetical protein
LGLFYVCNLAYSFKDKKIKAEKIKSLALWLNIRRTGASPASGTIIISSNREWRKKAYTFKDKKIKAEKIKSLALWLNIRHTGASPASGTIIISSNREWCKKASTIVGAFLRL